MCLLQNTYSVSLCISELFGIASLRTRTSFLTFRADVSVYSGGSRTTISVASHLSTYVDEPQRICLWQQATAYSLSLNTHSDLNFAQLFSDAAHLSGTSWTRLVIIPAPQETKEDIQLWNRSRGWAGWRRWSAGICHDGWPRSWAICCQGSRTSPSACWRRRQYSSIRGPLAFVHFPFTLPKLYDQTSHFNFPLLFRLVQI